MKSNFRLASCKLLTDLFTIVKNQKLQTINFYCMKRLIFGLIGVALSCSPKKNLQHEHENINANSQELSPNDPRLKHAFELAHDSLPFFIETFNKFHRQKEYNFFVRSKFVKGNNSERMWAKPILIFDNDFKCVLDSNPTTLEGYKFGDTVQVDFSEVEDYIIIFGDSVIGNYLQKEMQKLPVE